MFRKVLFSLLLLQPLLATPLIIGIAGGTASGKTTLAEKLQKSFPVHSILICQDHYYKDRSDLDFNERAKLNFDHPDSIDIDLLKKHLCQLKKGKAIHQPVYKFQTCSRSNQVVTISPTKIILVEGILLFAIPEIRDLCDLKIYIDTDDDIRILRRIERDILERGRDLHSVKTQYLTTVKPMHNAFVEPSKQFADVIIPSSRSNHIAFEMILSRISYELSLHQTIQ